MQFPENRNNRNSCPDGRRGKLTDDEIFTALVKLQLVEKSFNVAFRKKISILSIAEFLR